jgi:hypothetical protein
LILHYIEVEDEAYNLKFRCGRVKNSISENQGV